MYDQHEKLVASSLFSFQEKNDYCESLIWDRFVPHRECIDAVGKINELSASGRKTYTESLKARVDTLRQYELPNGRWGFSITHDPSEGIHHVHITLRPISHSDKINKNERKELRIALTKLFEPIEESIC